MGEPEIVRRAGVRVDSNGVTSEGLCQEVVAELSGRRVSQIRDRRSSISGPGHGLRRLSFTRRPGPPFLWFGSWKVVWRGRGRAEKDRRTGEAARAFHCRNPPSARRLAPARTGALPLARHCPRPLAHHPGGGARSDGRWSRAVTPRRARSVARFLLRGGSRE